MALLHSTGTSRVRNDKASGYLFRMFHLSSKFWAIQDLKESVVLELSECPLEAKGVYLKTKEVIEFSQRHYSVRESCRFTGDLRYLQGPVRE